MTKMIPALAALALLASTGLATAQQAGDWTLGLGLGSVNPQSDTGVLDGSNSTIDDDLRPILTFEYFIRDNIGLELLLATPFEHTVSLGGAGVAETTHLPPTLSINYHFTNDSRITPFLGAGVNYTHFLDTDGIGTLSGANVEIDNSFGWALNAGLDFELTDNSALRFNVRWIDIDADVHVNGNFVGTAEIDPIVYGISYVMRF